MDDKQNKKKMGPIIGIILGIIGLGIIGSLVTKGSKVAKVSKSVKTYSAIESSYDVSGVAVKSQDELSTIKIIEHVSDGVSLIDTAGSAKDAHDAMQDNKE